MLLPHKALKLSLLVLWSLMIRVDDHPNDAQPTDISETLSTQISINLKLAIVNFSSITNKRVELEIFLVNNSVDLLIGTESHLDTSVQDSQKTNTHRKYRNRFGGGILILVENILSSSQIDIQSSIEIIWVYLHAGKGSDIIIGSFYRPLHSADSVLDDLMSFIYTFHKREISLCPNHPQG